MAEEVEITNVGGDGVASEITLQELLKSFDRLSQKMGVDPNSTRARTQQSYNDSVKNGIKIVRDNSNAYEENTKAVDDTTSALGRFRRGLVGFLQFGLGALLSSSVSLSKELILGGSRLSDFTQHLPIVGSLLTEFTGYLDDTIDTLNSLSSVGASFNNSITDMRLAATEAMMTLDRFAPIVQRNADALAMIGGTVTQGARQFASVINQIRNSGIGEQLRNMGFTVEEISDGLANYARLQARTGRLEQMTAQQLAAGTGNYLKEVDRLAKLTGMERQEAEQAMLRAQTNASVRLMASQAQDEAGFLAGIGRLEQLPGNLSTALMDSMRNVQLTQEGQMINLLTGGRAKEIMQAFRVTGDQEQLNRDLAALGPIIEQRLGELGPDLVAAFGLSGGSAEVIAALMDSNFALNQINDNIGQGVTDAEQGAVDPATKELRDFRENIDRVRAALTEIFLENNGLDIFSSIMKSINTLIGNPQNIEAFANAIRTGLDYISNFVTGMMTDPIGTIEQTFEDALTGLDSLFTNVPFLASIKQGALNIIETLGLDHMFEDIRSLFGFDALPSGTTILEQASTTIQSLWTEFKKLVGIEPGESSIRSLWQSFKEFVGLPDALEGESVYEYLKRLVIGGYESLAGGDGPSLYQRIVDFIGFPETLGPEDSIWARLQRWVFGDEATGQESLWDRISAGASNLLTSITTWLTNALLGERGMNEYGEMGRGDRQGGLLKTIGDGLSSMFSALMDSPLVQNSLVQSIGTAFDAAKNKFETFIGMEPNETFSNYLTRMVDRLTNAILDIINVRIPQLISTAISAATGAAQDIFGGAAGSSLGPNVQQSLQERFLADPESLSYSDRQDLIQTLRAQQESSGGGNLDITGGYMPGWLSNTRDFINDSINWDALTTSDDALRRAIEAQGNSMATGSGGIRDFGAGTLSLLHGKEAVLTEGQINDLINTSAASSAGEIASTVASGNRESLDRLNTTMLMVLQELKTNNKLQEDIERNTGSSGNNIASGRVSMLRR